MTWMLPPGRNASQWVGKPPCRRGARPVHKRRKVAGLKQAISVTYVPGMAILSRAPQNLGGSAISRCYDEGSPGPLLPSGLTRGLRMPRPIADVSGVYHLNMRVPGDFAGKVKGAPPDPAHRGLVGHRPSL